MSLRLKTIIGIALIEAILLGILIFKVELFMRSSAGTALVKRAQTTATLFATTAKDPVLSFDLASLDTFSEELLANPDMEYVRVLDPQGQVLSFSGNVSVMEKGFQNATSLDDVNDGTLNYSAPIEEEGIVYGRVEIGINTDSVNAIIAENRQMSIAIAVTEMGLVALFSFLLGTYLTRQLNVLRRSARSISEGDYTGKIPIQSRDEVGEVAIAFNRMSTALRASELARDAIDAELMEANRTLEERVQRRTAQIQKQVVELQAANDKIADAQAQLVQSEKMASIGQLAAGVAHELNNPIGFVRSNMNTLAGYVTVYQQLLNLYQNFRLNSADREQIGADISSLEEKEDIEFIKEDLVELIGDSIEGTTRVRDIVQGLKDFSHVNEAGRIPCDINKCISSTLKIVNNELKYKCKIEENLQELPLVSANQGEINQVLMNLLINAGHAIDADGQIEISTAPCLKGISITVSDNGKGIEKEHLDKLYDPFFTTKPVGQGTGLGLSISFGIVKDHGGEIDVQSEPGVGTTFTIILPLNACEGELDQVA